MSLRLISSALVLSVLWLLMSGLYKPLILGFGVISVLLVLIIVTTMSKVDQDRPETILQLVPSIKYMVWLLVEIAKSNWEVTKVILARTMPIKQQLFRIPVSQQSDLGQVVYANSITLTPGTITVETEDEGFLVHALCHDESDYEALAEMDARVTALEAGGKQ